MMVSKSMLQLSRRASSYIPARVKPIVSYRFDGEDYVVQVKLKNVEAGKLHIVEMTADESMALVLMIIATNRKLFAWDRRQ